MRFSDPRPRKVSFNCKIILDENYITLINRGLIKSQGDLDLPPPFTEDNLHELYYKAQANRRLSLGFFLHFRFKLENVSDATFKAKTGSAPVAVPMGAFVSVGTVKIVHEHSFLTVNSKHGDVSMEIAGDLHAVANWVRLYGSKSKKSKSKSLMQEILNRLNDEKKVLLKTYHEDYTQSRRNLSEQGEDSLSGMASKRRALKRLTLDLQLTFQEANAIIREWDEELNREID